MNSAGIRFSTAGDPETARLWHLNQVCRHPAAPLFLPRSAK